MDRAPRPDLEHTFRSAVHTPVAESVGLLSYGRWTRSTWGWVGLTSVLTFVFLYVTNPPIVQCRRQDQDLSPPVPNYTSIALWSVLAGLAVWGFTWHNARGKLSLGNS